MGDAEMECDRMCVDGRRTARLVNRAMIGGEGKIQIIDSVWGAKAMYALRHLSVSEEQAQEVDKTTRWVKKKAMGMARTNSNGLLEGDVGRNMAGGLGVENQVMVEKMMMLVRALVAEEGDKLKEVIEVWVDRLQESTGRMSGVMEGRGEIDEAFADTWLGGLRLWMQKMEIQVRGLRPVSGWGEGQHTMRSAPSSLGLAGCGGASSTRGRLVTSALSASSCRPPTSPSPARLATRTRSTSRSRRWPRAGFSMNHRRGRRWWMISSVRATTASAIGAEASPLDEDDGRGRC